MPPAILGPMATLRRHVHIDRPADVVWAVIADAGAIADWFPHMAASSVAGDERRCRLDSGIELVEEIVTCDAELRRFQYHIVGGVPVRRHLATVDVIADIDGSGCHVLYSTEVEPAPLALVLGGAIGEALQNLRLVLESQAAEPPGGAARSAQ